MGIGEERKEEVEVESGDGKGGYPGGVEGVARYALSAVY